MPIYKYECENKECVRMKEDNPYEVILPLSKIDDEVKCPDCDMVLTRVITSGYFSITV